MRDDLKFRDLARSLGYSIKMEDADKDNGKHIDFKDMRTCPNFSLQFQKDNKHIWYCGGEKGWACAELVDNKTNYQNYRYDNNLETMLKKEQ